MVGRRGRRGDQEHGEPQSRHEQRQEDRHEFGRGGSSTRYKMKEKLVSFGDNILILAATVAVDQLSHDTA